MGGKILENITTNVGKQGGRPKRKWHWEKSADRRSHTSREITNRNMLLAPWADRQTETDRPQGGGRGDRNGRISRPKRPHIIHRASCCWQWQLEVRELYDRIARDTWVHLYIRLAKCETELWHRVSRRRWRICICFVRVPPGKFTSIQRKKRSSCNRAA